MSTSPKRALVSATHGNDTADVRPFPYEPIFQGSGAIQNSPFHRMPGPLAGDAQQTMAETEAYKLGRQTGLDEMRKEFEEQVGRERSSLATALQQFTCDRRGYFEKVEAEIVQLALSIASRILHREAQVDPLVLAGIVRVALEKIDGATGVLLRLNPQDAHDWRRYLATHLNPSDVPEIVEDASLPTGQCTLQTSMGTTQIGLEIQLKEIERGLMDLLSARPETV
jgi:flagellar assembly protein FliH